ncbi:MAG: UDP-N-acetylmuramate--L-alanine ligase [Lachnospiraceae bacterium]|nr:UDP-N-acetylmuramate--L-alanine ligase [Lachnospiraceae bacterium]
MFEIDMKKPCRIHFIGIGGISMSALAQVLADAGFRVSGSDRQESELTRRLTSQGITVLYGHRRSNITADLDVMVYTSAIHPDNPEYQAAVELQIPILSRAQLLGQIMKSYPTSIAVSGTHGKTSTTSMISDILMHAQADPTLLVGGILSSIGGNLRIGHSEYFVTEACEYTNSFLSFFPTVGLILNIEEDHLDFFKDLDDIRHSFREFAALIPAHGCLIINYDIPDLDYITSACKGKVITYTNRVGITEADYYPTTISYDKMARPTFTLKGPAGQETEYTLHVPGAHNVANAIAAIALADYQDIPSSISKQALSDFNGTDRRFQYKGTLGGITIVDDYAHHPTEIRMALTAARNMSHKRLWCVFQPHTYTRTQAFLEEFAEALSLADMVVLPDIYAAREVNESGISSDHLRQALENRGTAAYYFPTFDEVENFLLENCTTGDLLITMGAGDVVKIGENLLGI